MARRPAKQTGPKKGKLAAPLVVDAIKVEQGSVSFYVFKLKASQLWPMVSINRRSESEDRGYQRVLSNARVDAVATHIRSGKPLPNNVLIALDKGSYDPATAKLTIPAGEDLGWVIDGQHRIAGAHEAAAQRDIELCVFAFLGVDQEFQIEQFITINREQKGVPTALVYDLLSHLPNRKRPADIATERAAEIANELRRDPKSALMGRIVVTQSPGKGQVSITNFVRKIAPLVHPERGTLKPWTLPEQVKIISNYFGALKETYPEQWSKSDNIFFRTVGFGAMMNMFEEIFQVALATEGGVRVSELKQVMKGVAHFDFGQWTSYGSGNKAEIEAAQDFRIDWNRSRASASKTKSIRI